MGATTYTKGWSEGAWGINGWSGIAPAYSIDAGVQGTASVGTIALRINSNVTPEGVTATVFIGGLRFLSMM